MFFSWKNISVTFSFTMLKYEIFELTVVERSSTPIHLEMLLSSCEEGAYFIEFLPSFLLDTGVKPVPACH